jgi:hypothetical protein
MILVTKQSSDDFKDASYMMEADNEGTEAARQAFAILKNTNGRF